MVIVMRRQFSSKYQQGDRYTEGSIATGALWQLFLDSLFSSAVVSIYSSSAVVVDGHRIINDSRC